MFDNIYPEGENTQAFTARVCDLVLDYLGEVVERNVRLPYVRYALAFTFTSYSQC